MRRRYQNHLETDVGSYSGDTAMQGRRGKNESSISQAKGQSFKLRFFVFLDYF